MLPKHIHKQNLFSPLAWPPHLPAPAPACTCTFFCACPQTTGALHLSELAIAGARCEMQWPKAQLLQAQVSRDAHFFTRVRRRAREAGPPRAHGTAARPPGQQPAAASPPADPVRLTTQGLLSCMKDFDKLILACLQGVSCIVVHQAGHQSNTKHVGINVSDKIPGLGFGVHPQAAAALQL